MRVYSRVWYPRRVAPRCPVTGKATYKTRKLAEVTLRKIQEGPDFHGSGYKPQRVFECEFCGGWHMTSMEAPPERAVRECGQVGGGGGRRGPSRRQVRGAPSAATSSSTPHGDAVWTSGFVDEAHGDHLTHRIELGPAHPDPTQ